MANGSLRRGPTLSRNERMRRQQDLHSVDEITSDPSYATINIDMHEDNDIQEKQPIYQHGEETFGDVLTHPVKEMRAHEGRKNTFKLNLSKWSVRNKVQSLKNDESFLYPLTEYTLIVHFKQLKGNQTFVLDKAEKDDLYDRLNMTVNERVRFNGVRDTDGLTNFLSKTKRPFSIKLHQRSDMSEYKSDNHIIEFNENVYIEFKPKNVHHLHPEKSRRPFFCHPEPDLSADIGIEKAPSWLELFYDLFYIATLTKFTTAHHIQNWDALGLYTQWFIITWWAWCASSLYTARFDTDDVVHHLYKLVEMCAVICMAGSSDYFLNSPGYVYGYIVLKIVLAVEYSVVFTVALLTRSKSRIALAFYVVSNLLSIALWASSLTIIENTSHRVLWFLAVLLEVLVNVVVRSDKSLSWAASHLAERFGLLSLIVLGENLMGLVSIVMKAGTEWVIVGANFIAVGIVFGFFFMYFEDFSKEIFLYNKFHQVWVYLHFPLHLCQIAFGIALMDILAVHKVQLIRDNVIASDSYSTIKDTSTSGHSKRAPTTDSYGADMGPEEVVFIYKTFLIFGGLILVLNSLIKMLNTKLNDFCGKFIVGSRIFNAIVLWCICAITFEGLNAIVLLYTMLGSVIIQGAIDLLD